MTEEGEIKMKTHCFKCQKLLTNEDIWYGLHHNCFKQWFDLDNLEEFLDVAVRSQSQAPLENRSINSSFFHGKFRKYSSRLGGVSYILKVEQNEYPELPATEFLSNQIYENLKIKVPNYYLVRFPEDQICFVTKNFMSDLMASTLDHIYHFVKPETNYDCETLVNIIGDKTGRRIEQENFVYLTLADSLIGNNDRHGRNLGFIRSAKGMHLAPFYDNPSALGVEDTSFLGADLQPRGSIFTCNSNEPTMKDYVHEWNRLGFASVVAQFRKTLSLSDIPNLVQASHLSEKRKQALLRLITKRSEELCKN